MCGLSGCLTENLQLKNDLIPKIVTSQQSRGPDHTGSFDKTISNFHLNLSHNRLKIVDLSDAANQPMNDRDRTVITFNGEIYNYREIKKELASDFTFITSSDTEVILKAYTKWGIKAFSHFNGMFAFALFDFTKNELLLVRDRFGVKPLYYYFDGKNFIFAQRATEIAKYFHLPINPAFIARGLKTSYYHESESATQFENLYQVPAGHFIKISIESLNLKLTTHRYYDLRASVTELAQRLPQNEEKLAELVKDNLERAVNLRLRADVPCAISLSGGLDSSTVAAIAKNHEGSLTAFSIGNPSQKESEGPQVAELSKKIGIDTRYISFNSEELLGHFWQTLQAQEAPFAGLSVVAQHLLMKKVHESGYKVLLGGQGGDEAFLGYRKFFLYYLIQLLKEKNLISIFRQSKNIVQLILGEAHRLPLYWRQRYRYQNQADILLLPTDNHYSLSFNGNATLFERQIQDITSMSLPTLLRYEDRNSMAYSVETRLPFVDYQLIELALALPIHLKMHQGYGKWIVRDVMRERLPHSICFAREKRGFDIASSNQLLADLGHSLRSFFMDNREIAANYIGQRSPEELFSDKNLQTQPQFLHSAIALAWLIKPY